MNTGHRDFDLLQRFARQRDQTAFAVLVQRHLDLVYATAVGKTRDAEGAKEISQNVFSALVRKAWQFGPDDSLPAWLHKTALLESKQWLRGELRRRRREQFAVELGTTMNSPQDTAALNALAPLLDEGLLSLREKDRAALLMRFYENRSLREVGETMGVGEDAAQKRVASALDKLSRFFLRRGFKSATAAATAATLKSVAASAPGSLTGTVLQSAAQIAPPTLAGMTGFLARMATLTKLQTGALAVILAAAPAAWQFAEHHQAVIQLTAMREKSNRSTIESAATQNEIDRLHTLSIQLTESNRHAEDTAQKKATDYAKYIAWKERVRKLLASGDYRWPEDSPFVRIPKKLVPKLGAQNPFAAPGVLKPVASELLGLTPEERSELETALHTHMDAVSKLIDDHAYETNKPTWYNIPKDATVSQVWAVPPLEDALKASSGNLAASLQSILGSERWPMIKGGMSGPGMDEARAVLDLDGDQTAKEAVGWIQMIFGRLTVGFASADASHSTATSGIDLAQFASEASADSSVFPETEMPAPLRRRLLAWFQQQAIAVKK